VQAKNNRKKRGFGKTVLIVDDSAVIRKMLVTAFLADGFRMCEQMENGEEAIEAAERIRPDVIILDLSMPVMNGLQAASELRKILPNTPIILFSLYTDLLLETDASNAGVTLVFPKTDPIPGLLDKAHELMAADSDLIG
jgi:chemotaxis response regulator CheB